MMFVQTESFYVEVDEDENGQLFVKARRLDERGIILMEYAGDDNNFEVDSAVADAIEMVLI